jgi:hypothetical protein
LEDTQLTENEKSKNEQGESKVMIVFFDIRGIIMIEWVSEGQKVNQLHYGITLRSLPSSENE